MVLDELKTLECVHTIYSVDPVFYVKQGKPLFTSARVLSDLDREHQRSLGKLGLEYESTLLSMPEEKVQNEMLKRFAIMKQSCSEGFRDDSNRQPAKS